MGVELAGDEAFETADGFGIGFAFCASSGDVGAGVGVVFEADDHDSVERCVGLAVAGSAEAVAGLLTRACFDRGDAAELRERGFSVDAMRVVAGGAQQGRGRVGADAVFVEQIRCRLADQGGDHVVDLSDVGSELFSAAGEVAHCPLDGASSTEGIGNPKRGWGLAEPDSGEPGELLA